MTRNDLIIGPALCTFKGAKWFSKDDISVAVNQETFNIETSPHGLIDERALDVRAECSFTPAGQWNQAFIDAMWGYYANMVIGTSIFGATDTALTLKSTVEGGTHTLPCAAVTKLPDIVLSATKTLLGSTTLTGIRGLLGTSWAVGSSGSNGPVYVIGSSDGDISDSSFETADIITQPYGGVWTATGFTSSFQTEEGWTISFDLQTEPRQVDSVGTLDYKFKSIGIMARCVPIEPTAAQILAAMKIQGTGAIRGRSFAAGAGSLVITGASNGVAHVTIPLANLKTGGFRFGSTVLRNNEIGFVGARPFSAGAQGALYTIAAS